LIIAGPRQNPGNREKTDISMKTMHASIAAITVIAAISATSSVRASDPLPSYNLRFIGEGTVVAINNVNTLVGMRTNASNLLKTPLVSLGGASWTTVPLPAGATGGFPTALNDSGTIVGVADMSGGRRAVRWPPGVNGYAVDVLPLPPGELASYATGINNNGDIVGARAGILGTPYGFGWLHTGAGGIISLDTQYGWFATPNDINDHGVILSGTQTFDLATQTVSDVGLSGPASDNPIGGVVINNAGQILGNTTLRSSSLNIAKVYRYTPGAGWLFISGTSKYTAGTSLNNTGDVGWGELGAGIYIEGIGPHALGSLLDPATAAAGWSITGNGCLINDHRVVATLGKNTGTAQTGVVLLTPVGQLPPPAAPTGLVATPHPATSSEPYMSINLSWTHADPILTRTYELERRVRGQTAWSPVPLVPPYMSTLHQDTTVAPGIAYDYRVRAVGVAGPGPWSAIATATAPADPLDTTRPEVFIVSPANSANVSGIVSISATASDNVGVSNLEISYWNPYLGREIILGSASDSDSHTANWDTRGLPTATYAIRVIASDAIGNWQRAEVSVNVSNTSGDDPDGDGQENLIELALGTPPMQSNPCTVQTTLEQVGEARHLQLDVMKNPLAGNVIFRAEVADNPAGPWSSDPLTAVEILHEDNERLIARDRTPVAAAARRFIRLRVGSAP
jgi:Bacterial Ig domain